MASYALVYSERLKEYDLGHVLTGERYEHFLELFRRTLGNHPEFELIEPDYARDEDLRLIHSQGYIDRIRRCESRDPLDTPLTPAYARGATLLAGAGKTAADLVGAGQYAKVFVVGGGVQHANREQERGFGVFSDVGICAEQLLRHHGLERVMTVDVDAHAGEGIYEIFMDDPRVLTVSLHQDPATLYPGQGFAEEIGQGDGEGYAVNIPLAPESGLTAYQHVLDAIVHPVAEAFAPQALLMVDGSDPHFSDRITQMGLTLADIRAVSAYIRQLADELYQGRMVDFIGSGYSRDRDVVALGWLASIAGATGVKLDLQEPVTVPNWVNPDNGLDEARQVAQRLVKILRKHWPSLGGGSRSSGH